MQDAVGKYYFPKRYVKGKERNKDYSYLCLLGTVSPTKYNSLAI